TAVEANAGESGAFENLTADKAEVPTIIADDEDLTTVSIKAIVTKTSEINVGNVDNTESFTVKAYKSNGMEGELSKITGTDHDGFGVKGSTSGSGDERELGYGSNGV